MTFLAYCSRCEKTVTAMTLQRREEINSALASDGDITVMHVAENDDHEWKLNRYEREHLRRMIADGLV